METTELIELLSRGEDSRHQFKTDVTNANALAAEMVAFSNSSGGRIFIGVNDDGSVSGLSSDDVTRLNQLIANTATNNVRPAMVPLTENVSHPLGIVLVLTVPEGITSYGVGRICKRSAMRRIYDSTPSQVANRAFLFIFFQF